MYYELSEMLAHKDSKVLALFRGANSGIPVLCFLGQAFKKANRPSIPMNELVELVRRFQQVNHGNCKFPFGESDGEHKSPIEVVNSWCSDSEGILRRWVPSDSNEPLCEMTPVAETALKMFMGLSVDSTGSLECNFDIALHLLGKSVRHFNSDPAFRRKEIENDLMKLRAELELIKNDEFSRDTVRGQADCRQAINLLYYELPSSFRKVEAEWRKDLEETMEDIAKLGDQSFSGKVEIFNRIHSKIEQKRKFEQSREAKDFDKFYAMISSDENIEQTTRRLNYLLSQPEIRELELPENVESVIYRLYQQAESARKYKSKLQLQLGNFIEAQSWDENKAIEKLWFSITKKLLKLKDADISPSEDETFLNFTVPKAHIYLPGEVRERELTVKNKVVDTPRIERPQPEETESLVNALKFYIPAPVSDLRKAFDKLGRNMATFSELMEIIQPNSLTAVNTYLDAVRSLGVDKYHYGNEREKYTFVYEGRRFAVDMQKLFVRLPVEESHG